MFLLTGCGMRQRTVIIKEPFAHQSALSACSGSFDNFAFSTPDIDSDSQKHFLPMPPWVQADSIPAQENGFGYHVEAVTLYGDQKQIWVRAGMINPNSIAFAIITSCMGQLVPKTAVSFPYFFIFFS